MIRRVGIFLAILLMLFLPAQFSLPSASAENVVISEALTLTAYLDGFVQVLHELEVNQSYPTANVTLLSEAFENLLVLDEDNLPLDYSTANSKVLVYTLGSSKITISYFSQDLTFKTGKYWTLKTDVGVNTTVLLPENASIISLSTVPEQIESSNGQVILVMPSGLIEITYIGGHSFSEQAQAYEPPWLLIVAISLLSIPIAASAFRLLKRKKPAKAKESAKGEVDLDKLFEREKNLRREEEQVIRFLAEKNGTAFEAELYEKLELPRTTTWRLLKRLEKMEIVEIKKSRRQNIISIKRKYIKK